MALLVSGLFTHQKSFMMSPYKGDYSLSSNLRPFLIFYLLFKTLFPLKVSLNIKKISVLSLIGKC